MIDRKLLRKLSFSLIVIFIMLGTFLGIESNANSVPAEFFSPGYSLPDYGLPSQVFNGELRYNITVDDLRREYAILCCQHGTALPGGDPVPAELTGIVDDVTNIQQTATGLGKRTNVTTRKYTFGSITTRTKSWYKVKSVQPATPEEAYILAEMILDTQSLPVDMIIYVDGNGNRQEVEEGRLEAGFSYEIGGERYVLYDIEYAVETDEGTFVVEYGGTDANGNPWYKYKVQAGGNDYVRFDGNLHMVDPKFQIDAGMSYREVDQFNYVFEGEGGKPANLVEHGKVYITSNKAAKYDQQSGKWYAAYCEGGDYYVQYAWWASPANIGNYVAPNALSKEAKAFEQYILRVTRSASVAEVMSKYVEFPYDIEFNGTRYTGTVPAAPIEYGAEYMEPEKVASILNVDAEEGKPTVSWDEEKQVYKIGPFAIDYVEERVHIEGRDEVEFAGITGMKLFTNLGEVPADKWRLIFLKDQRTEGDTYQYPHEQEPFYIELDYIEGAIEVTDLQTSFRFMNAGGKYEELEGVYNKVTWKAKYKTYSCSGPSGNETSCSHGYSASHYYYDEWIDITAVTPTKSQKLASGLVGYRWYDETEIHLNVIKLPHEGRISITKEISNSDNKFKDKFKFKVFINGEYSETIVVKPGQTKYSATYRWEDGEPAPTYKVEEIEDNPEFTLESIENAEGTITEGTPIKVIAKNKVKDHHGKLKIDKIAIGDDLQDKVFTFEVTIGSEKITAEISAATGWSWTSNEYTWQGDNAPRFTISEVNLPEGTTLLGIVPSKGTLKDDETGNLITCTATNKGRDYENGSIDITKVVQDTDVEYDKDAEFQFKVTIDGGLAGHEERIVKMKAGQTKSVDGIRWIKGTPAPTYTVEEIKIPAGFVFVDLENEHGTVGAGHEVQVKAINGLEEHRGKLKIDKVVQGNIQNLDFKFEVVINGETQIITLNQGNGFTWTSSEYTWKGDKGPGFSVREIDIPEGVKLVGITPSTGNLEEREDGLPITVTAINSEDQEFESGNLKVTKVLENGTSDDLFEFLVTIDGGVAGHMEIPFKIKAGQSKTIAGIKWKKGETPPTYKVEEVKVPESSQFVRMENGEDSLKAGKTVEVVAINKLVEHKGSLKIDKIVQGNIKDLSFDFEVKIGDDTQTITLNQGNGFTWTSSEYTWTGETGPAFSVKEINIPEGVELVGITPSSGNLIETTTNVPVTVTAINKATDEHGNFQITKKLDGNAVSDEPYTFNVKVSGGYAGNAEYEIKLQAGKTYVSPEIYWAKGTPAPTYEVTEVNIPDGSKLVEIQNGTGSLKENDTVKVVAINELERHSGSVTAQKECITDQKLQDEAIDGEFTINIRVSGTFEANGESVVNGTRTYSGKVGAGGTVQTPEIVWYGSNAPTYSVNESDLPTGWILQGITNQTGVLTDGESVDVLVTNTFTSRIIIDLTIELGGIVWEDEFEDTKLVEGAEHTGEGKITDGLYDASKEEGIAGVEVYVEKILFNEGDQQIGRTEAVAYEEDGTPISFPILTSAEDLGRWKTPRVELGLTESEKSQGATYARFNIRFTYDGQTFEPTRELVTGSAEDYRFASTSNRDRWRNNSMALDIDREEVNNRVAEIYGGNEANGNKTEGYVQGTDGTVNDITYVTTDGNVNANTIAKSELITLDNNGVALDVFKANATTEKAGLVYPFDGRVHLLNWDKYIDELGLVEEYHYSATYEYTKNINLGLKRRATSDLSIAKDLNKAVVVANKKMLTYKYNKVLDKLSEGAKYAIESKNTVNGYKLDIYDTDYYYRAAIYQNSNSDLYNALNAFYQSIGKTGAEAAELEVYLNYKILVFNNSQGDYVAKVREVADYFDKSLTLVKEETTAYVQTTTNGNLQEGLVVVAKAPSYETSNGAKGSVEWTESTTNIPTNANYTAMKTSSLSEVKLARGEYAILDMTFKVNKDTNANGVENCIILGEKNNISEIARYSIYDKQDKIQGKIDLNSAPANINFNENYFEDDTDAAPVVNIGLYETERQINGLVFEDAQTKEIDYDQIVGDGKYVDGEDRPIAGMPTDLVEKVIIPEGSSYREYSVIWKTDDPTIAGLGGHTIEELTGFDSTLFTINDGTYEFKAVPAGNYTVRFTYGDQKITTSPIDENIEVYNGQDYKTTAYQVGYATVAEDGTISNEWHDLANEALRDDRVNDARDDEARRLDVIAKSKVL